MTDRLQSLNEDDQRRVAQIGQELSKYGLGISVPHAHDVDGRFGPLPLGVVAYENDLKVSFISSESVPANAIAVGWRYIEGELRASAYCCKDIAATLMAYAR